jgi:hypothetical protein
MELLDLRYVEPCYESLARINGLKAMLAETDSVGNVTELRFHRVVPAPNILVRHCIPTLPMWLQMASFHSAAIEWTKDRFHSLLLRATTVPSFPFADIASDVLSG